MACRMSQRPSSATAPDGLGPRLRLISRNCRTLGWAIPAHAHSLRCYVGTAYTSFPGAGGAGATRQFEVGLTAAPSLPPLPPTQWWKRRAPSVGMTALVRRGLMWRRPLEHRTP